MQKRKLILDVDTGSDDALAIMSALLSPEFEVLGICTVKGNLPLPNTTENTLRVVELLKADVPVIRGCATPIVATLDPTVITKMRHLRCDVVCGGIADGQTLFDTRYFTDLPKNVYVSLDTDEEKFAKMMVDILSR